jgi:predicted acetyltransferase
MSNNSIYYGRGTKEMFDDYMDFINYVFGFNGNSSDFKKLLPKLYKYDYEPAVNSYVAVEDGKIKSAIGAFDHDISVCGNIIKTRGIGNVAVHPYARGNGYMKKLMNMALDDMVSDGVALSVLGGRRQRYNYFSYDKLGQTVYMSFNDDNFRHVFGSKRTHEVEFRRLNSSDIDIFSKIKQLSESYPFFALRDLEKYYDILCSWEHKVYAGFSKGEFVGYAVVGSSTVYEMLVTDLDLIRAFVTALYDHLSKGALQIKIPVFLPDYIEKLYTLCESYSVDICKSFSVLNYQQVVKAFLELKKTYTELPDGSLVLEIDGRGGLEKIEISVINGVPDVKSTEQEADIVLEHLEAMNLIFAGMCPSRERLPLFARVWFPLPIYLYNADAV